MYNFLILTDSIGNPRSFPVWEITQLEETYPYLLRDNFKDSTFWQLSYGNITTEQLVSQAIGYLSNWEPDFIIIHSGIIDSRPEAFTEIQKMIITTFSGQLFSYISKYVHHPKLIKRRQLYRVSKRSFRKTAKKLKLLFEQSKTFWLEICAADGYESARPGVSKRITDYNRIIEKIYGEDIVRVRRKILEVDGFNKDNLHWNKRGHRAVADIIYDKISHHSNKV